MATITVYALPGGKIQIFVDGMGVSDDEARARTLEVLALLRAQGLPLRQDSAIERHRTGSIDHVHLEERLDVES